MKTLLLSALGLLLAFAVSIRAEEGKPTKTWPFHDLPRREAWMADLRLRLFHDGVFHSLPKGITLFLDADEEPDEDGWLMVTVRQRNGEGSGGDPNVAPALVHFHIRDSDGKIEWYDVVNDERRPYADFLKDRKPH